MKIKTLILLSTLSILFSTSCFEDRDDNGVYANEINDFVWKGMNAVYLYKSNIPDLADERFSSNEEYGAYLNSFETPESLFESLIYQRETVDKYSWIVDDYIALEQLFSGVSTSNGMEFQLFLEPNTNTQVMGIVRLVLPNSDADMKGIKRGDIFNTINSDFLHNVAVLIVLMKSYRILVEYMRFRHIDMKFMLEIGIIACILELLFFIVL